MEITEITETWENIPFKSILVTSWWLNQPLWKICPSNWIHFPRYIGVKIKNHWNHQPGYTTPKTKHEISKLGGLGWCFSFFPLDYFQVPCLFPGVEKPWNWHKARETRPSQKERIVFQSPLFRGELLVSERVYTLENCLFWTQTWRFVWMVRCSFGWGEGAVHFQGCFLTNLFSLLDSPRKWTMEFSSTWRVFHSTCPGQVFLSEHLECIGSWKYGNEMNHMDILIYSGNACEKKHCFWKRWFEGQKVPRRTRTDHTPNLSPSPHMHADGNEEEQQGKFTEEPNREKNISQLLLSVTFWW